MMGQTNVEPEYSPRFNRSNSYAENCCQFDSWAIALRL